MWLPNGFIFFYRFDVQKQVPDPTGSKVSKSNYKCPNSIKRIIFSFKTVTGKTVAICHKCLHTLTDRMSRWHSQKPLSACQTIPQLVKASHQTGIMSLWAGDCLKADNTNALCGEVSRTVNEENEVSCPHITWKRGGLGGCLNAYYHRDIS